MRTRRNRRNGLSLAKLATKGERGQTLLRATALIGAVVAGVVMEILRRKYRGVRKLNPEVSAGRNTIRVGVRTSSRRRGRAGTRSNGASRVRRAVRSGVHAAGR